MCCICFVVEHQWIEMDEKEKYEKIDGKTRDNLFSVHSGVCVDKRAIISILSKSIKDET